MTTTSPQLFDRTAAKVVAKHGIAITWTPDGGSPTELAAIFDHDYFSDTGGVGQQSMRAVATIATASAPTVAVGDAITADGLAWTIKEIQPDGAGMAELLLWRAT